MGGWIDRWMDRWVGGWVGQPNWAQIVSTLPPIYPKRQYVGWQGGEASLKSYIPSFGYIGFSVDKICAQLGCGWVG